MSRPIQTALLAAVFALSGASAVAAQGEVYGSAHHAFRVVNVAERLDGSRDGRPGAGADWSRAFWRTSPAALEFIKSRVELSPLAAREEAPLERVLKPIVVRSIAAAGQFRPGSPD